MLSFCWPREISSSTRSSFKSIYGGSPAFADAAQGASAKTQCWSESTCASAQPFSCTDSSGQCTFLGMASKIHSPSAAWSLISPGQILAKVAGCVERLAGPKGSAPWEEISICWHQPTSSSCFKGHLFGPRKAQAKQTSSFMHRIT